MITESITRDIRSIEAERCRALEGKDEAALSSILDPDFVYIHATGKPQHRDDYIRDVITSATGLADFRHFDTELRAIGGCVVMGGELEHARDSDGVRRDVRFRYTSIWSRNSDGWQLVLWHNTKVTY